MGMGAGVLELDLHGKNQHQARLAIDAALRRARGLYRLRLIHGFRQGTAIQDMILQTYDGDPRVLRIVPGGNPGQTELVLREY